MTTKVRTHVLLSKKLLDEIDALVGERKRSQYIEQALQERVQQDDLLAIMERIASTDPPEGDPPEWNTPEGVAKWVRDLRREESGRTRRLAQLQPNESVIS